METNENSKDKIDKIITAVESAVQKKLEQEELVNFAEDENESTVIVKGKDRKGADQSSSSPAVTILSLVLLAILVALLVIMLRPV